MAVYWDNWGVNAGYIVAGGDISVPQVRVITYTSTYDGKPPQRHLTGSPGV